MKLWHLQSPVHHHQNCLAVNQGNSLQCYVTTATVAQKQAALSASLKPPELSSRLKKDLAFCQQKDLCYLLSFSTFKKHCDISVLFKRRE